MGRWQVDDHHLRRQRGEGIAAAGQIVGDKGVAIASASIAA
jgi:hypothetical protein